MTRFNFSHQTADASEALRERLFGMLPACLSWASLAGLVVFCVARPLDAVLVVIAIDIYWLMRMLYMTLFLILAYAVLAVEKETDWMERCRMLEKGAPALPFLRERRKGLLVKGHWREWVNLKNQERELRKVLDLKLEVPHSDEICHVVIIAAAREGREILEPGLEAMVHSRFPARRILPILAIEGRSGRAQEAMARALQQKYCEYFFDFLVEVHPDGIPGEARVKGANVTYAARGAAEFLKKRGSDYGNVVLSCFDADTVASPQYFAALTYHFMRHPKRTRASFQPIPVYHNNILEASAFARVLETGSSFFQLIEATNPEKLVTFSSHSMSFKALVEVGYWPCDMISDDSAIFWKALIHYRGDYRVVPMYVTLSMDVLMAPTVWKTLKSVYRQKLRWAWGVENFPILMRAFLARDSGLSLPARFRYLFKMLEMHISWATLGFIITFVSWLPGIFAGQEFSNTVFYYNSPRITGLIFNLAWASLAVTIILALLLLPKDKRPQSLWKRVVLASEWFLIPFIFTFLSCLPALDAQTRLAFGRMIKFRVSEKTRSLKESGAES